MKARVTLRGSTVVLVSAGRGTRLQARVPKAWVSLCGAPLFTHSLRTFHALPWVRRVVVVMEPGWLARARRLVRAMGFRKAAVVAGGKRRQDSVRRGIAAARVKGREVVLIHDCARPFVDPVVAARVAAAARRDGAALAALPVVDTVKRAGAGNRVVATLSREGLWLAQTPQAIRGDLVRRWLRETADRDVTDDVQPIESLGVAVRLVPGRRSMAKVTVREDLDMARKIGRGEPRVGLGFDLHRLVRGRRLVLGGVRVPFPKGLDGHSDADVVCHALTDAVLGATGGGDIGARFGVRREATRGLPSVRFLETAVAEAAGRGWRVGNADVVLLAQAPKIGPYRRRMIGVLARAMRVEPGRVSVKATTAKRTGDVGRGEAMACFAVVTVAPGDGVKVAVR